MRNVSKTIQALLSQRGKAKKMLDEDGKPIKKELRALLGLLASGKMPHKLSDVPKTQRSKVAVR
jgi:hypothetical protein